MGNAARSAAVAPPEQPKTSLGLRRVLSLRLLVLYGLGTTVGAGIYALTGKIAGLAGVWAPVSFGLACVLAAFTALSFGELASRYPKSAGEAVYLQAGFGLPRLAQLGGFFVCLAAATSSATLSRAAVGYLGDLTSVWQPGALLALVLGIGLVATWGVRESVTVAAILTVVEIGGVILVAGAGALFLGFGEPTITAASSVASELPMVGVLSGAVLGFYAFLGFEDMVNVAEEVKQPRRNVPLGIVITLIMTAALYLALSSVAVLTVAPAALAASEAPLTLIYATAGGPLPQMISGIGAAGMMNGILIQMIMGSRVLYGLASEGGAPPALATVHPRTQTPVFATALIVFLVLLLVFFFPLESLARGTSWITLLLFTLLNGALFRIKGRRDEAPPPVLVPRWVPGCGMVLCGALLLRDLWTSLR